MKTLDELDILAAENLMGFKPTTFTGNWYTTNKGIRVSNERATFDWQPTRNIAQAWECLEKLGKDGWKATIYAGDQRPSCVVFKYSESIHVYGQTPAEAIVMSCVKVKGVNLDE